MNGRTALFFLGIFIAGLSHATARPASGQERAQVSSAEKKTQSKVKTIHELIARYHQYGQFDGVILVAQRDNILYERAFGQANLEWGVPNTIDTKFEIASMTKPMTAILIMQLVEQGKVRLDGKVSDYVPYYPHETGAKITVDQLLNHTSGLQQDIAFPENSNDVPPIVAKINADLLSNDELVKLIAARPLRFEPGAGYGYSSDGYAVLGAIIEHVTGKPYWRVLKERILQPAGMTNTVPALLIPLVLKRASGYRKSFAGVENAPHIGATPAGGLYSTLHDMYQWERALYGTSLVSRQSKDVLFSVRKVITAYGWKTAEEEWAGKRHTVLRTTGGLPGFANLLLRVPDQERVIILLSNVRGSVYRLDEIAGAINRILDGAPYEMPKRSIAEALLPIIERSGVDAALAQFEKMRQRPAEYSLSETEMNSLGYYLLNTRSEVKAALAVFRLTAEAFPNSANAHDSLGEAYLRSGNQEEAARSYRRSLELDPNNGNARDVLRKLGK
jgi:CubicO group peptidase (beta-lactamase class C family)